MLKKFGMQLKIEAASTVLEDIVTEKPTKPTVIEPKRSDFLYFRARAITAGDFGPIKGEPNPNGNGDYFSKKELEASYQTFVGRNLFLNHDSDHPVKSIGKIIDAYAVDDPETGEYYVECLAKIDRKLHPEMARKVETGELDKVSMGCSVEESKCSICGHIIHTDEDEKCQHLSPTGLLKVYDAEIDLPDYKIKKGEPLKAFAINTGITFNELSIVNVPADSRAVIKTVIANLRYQFKKDSLDKKGQLDLISQLELILNQFDEKTKEEVKAEFCNICKEDKSMSDDKLKSNEDTDVQEILKRMNAFDFMRLQRHLEKKANKEEVKVELPKVEVKVEKEAEVKIDSSDKRTLSADEELQIQQIVDKVKNSFASKIFSQTVKRAIDEIQEVKIEPVKVEEPKVEAVEKPIIQVRAEFKQVEDILKSTWTLFDGDKQLVQASLSDIWGDEFPKFQEWAISSDYGTELVARYLDKENGGMEKITELLGISTLPKEAAKVEEVKTEYKLDHPKKDEFVKPGETTKEDKAAEKSSEAIVTVNEAGTHLEDSKVEDDQKKEASLYTDFTKKYLTDNPGASIADAAKAWSANKKETPAEEKKEVVVEEKKEASVEVKAEPIIEEPKVDEPIIETPKVEVKEEMSTCASAFDKVDEIVLGDGFVAHKDPETKEIVILDKDAKEVKRLPDGFGDDVVSVMKLLRSVMELKEEEQKPEEEKKEVEEKVEEIMEEPKPEELKEEKSIEEKIEEPKVEKETAYAAKEEALKKKADELTKKEAELKATEAKLNAARFSSVVNSKLERCKKIIESMLDKDVLDIKEGDIKEALDNGKTLLDARYEALQKSISKQITTLLAMDEITLKAFSDSISRIKKVASKKLARPIHVALPTEDEDSDVNRIFKSMGTLKNQ